VNTGIFIGLGSNLGDAVQNFDKACDRLSEHCKIMKKSSLYITKPYGHSDQPDFTNAAIEVESNLKARDLLSYMQKVEKELGKVVICKNGPRCIDLDLIFYGSHVVHDDFIRVPHPDSHLRDFVLLPLCDIAPDFIHPLLNKTMRQLLSEIKSAHHTGSVIDW
jgi:2-amino-4-hydroxy-6-hydroxymethyldihydropteridine diphosphokinase